MKRAAFLLAISLIVVSCGTMQQGSQDVVSRAVQALGGADTLAGVKTLSVKGTVRHWEPEERALVYASRSASGRITIA